MIYEKRELSQFETDELQCPKYIVAMIDENNISNIVAACISLEAQEAALRLMQE